MRHLVPAAIFLAIAFFLLVRRFQITSAYFTLSWIPLVLMVVAVGDEHLYGFGWFTHVMFHLAYDTSYFLTLLGIVLVLNFILRRKSIAPVLLPIVISVTPLAYLILFNP